MDREFIYLNRETVNKYLTPEDVISVIKRIWKNWKKDIFIEGEHTFLPAGIHTGNEFLHMPACLPEDNILGFKWINCYTDPACGYPFSHDNIVVLNDMTTGSLKAIVNVTDITAMRTAGGHGVAAARCLQKGPLKTLSVLGNGSQAVCGIRGFLCEFPEIESVKVYCRRKEAFESMKKMFEKRVRLEYVEDSREAGKDADVILAATSSREVLLKYEDLTPGVTVIALNGFIDIDPAISYKADKWFVGNLRTDRKEIIDSKEMSHGQDLNDEDIYGELPKAAAGMIQGRESGREIIVYTHMGLGVYDVACADLVYQKAAEKKDGVRIQI